MKRSHSQTLIQHAVGEMAGTGSYRCCRCGKYTSVLLGPEDQIPPCEICGPAEDVRYIACDSEANESHGVPETPR